MALFCGSCFGFYSDYVQWVASCVDSSPARRSCKHKDENGLYYIMITVVNLILLFDKDCVICPDTGDVVENVRIETRE